MDSAVCLKPLFRLALLALLFPVRLFGAVETYAIDVERSSLAFSIRNVVGRIPGSFTRFSGQILLDRDAWENSSVEAAVVVPSITTGNDQRDTHLKGPEFFDTRTFVVATFKSRRWQKTGPSAFEIAGDLTLHGITRPVVLKASLLGFDERAGQPKRVRWKATASIKRRDFGVNGPVLTGRVIGETATLVLSIEAELK